MSHSYFVRYLTREGQAYLKICPNWRKLLGWLLRESRSCVIIYIWIGEETG